MNNNSSPIPPNHPFLSRTPPFPFPDGSTSQFIRPSQFGRAPRPLCPRPVFGSTDIRERKKVAPQVPNPPRRANSHQPSTLGPAFVHAQALPHSSPSLSSNSQSPTKISSPQQASLKDLSMSTLQSKSHVSKYTPSTIRDDKPTAATPDPSISPHKALIASGRQSPSTSGSLRSGKSSLHPQESHKHHPQVDGLHHGAPALQHSSPNFQRPKLKQDEEEIVSEALAFLEEYKKKKSAEKVQKSDHNVEIADNTPQDADKDTESKETVDENCSGQDKSGVKGELVKHFEKLGSSETVAFKENSKCSEEGESRQSKVDDQPFPTPPAVNCKRSSFSVDKRKSVMDASIQELSTLLANYQVGSPAVSQSSRGDQDLMLVDLTDYAEVSNVAHCLKQSELVSGLPGWFSNLGSHSSDEEERADGAELLHSKEMSMSKDAPIIAEDEILKQGFILSEPHSLSVSTTY